MLAVRARQHGVDLPMPAGAPMTSLKQNGAEELEDMHQKVDLEYRRKHGQFFTPPKIAEFMAAYGTNCGVKTVIDPGCGMGVFIDKMLELPGSRHQHFLGIDEDADMINACHLQIEISHKQLANCVRLRNQNYLLADNIEKVDFLICNPPYINFHNFDRKLIKKISSDFGVKFSMLTNIYALFMVKAKDSVKKGGRIAFITPSEFFYTGYGKALKKFILQNYTIDAFVTFDFDSKVFDDALTTSTISFLINKKPKKDHYARFIKTGGRLDGIMKMSRSSAKLGVRIRKMRQTEIDPNAKWQNYFGDAGASKPIMDKLVPLGSIADVKRGIATGSNEFFTLSSREKKQWEIEDDFLVPVISRAAQVKGYEVTKKTMTNLDKNGQKVFLLYCFKAPSKNLAKYIRHGENKGVNSRYLCVHRTPWYAMERRNPAPILSTVFSRENMRFVHNAAGSLNLASYHGVYPHSNDKKMTAALLCYLNSSLCMSMQSRTRREYGSGLHKFEPSDLADLPVMPMSRLDKNDIDKMALLFRRMAKSASNGSKSSARQKLDDAVSEIASSLCFI